METEQEQEEKTTYLSCSETAKLIRKALKENFPSQKFSVRSSVYSMGASIDVSWTDGIPHDEVNKIIKQFEGAGFDGMIDYKYYIDHWMMPDGSVIIAKSEGTTHGSSINNAKPHPDAKKVSLGSDYVFANRTISEDKLISMANKLAELENTKVVNMTDYPENKVFTGNNWWGIAREFLWNENTDNILTSEIVRTDITCAGDWKDFYKIVPKEDSNGN